MRRHLPPAERVEVLLKANPAMTWEEVEARLTSLWINCPAKGTEVSMGEACCQGCPHLERIDYEHYRIQCKYQPTEVRRLELIIPDGVELQDLDEGNIPPFIVASCPLTGRISSIANCIGCLYYRGEEEEQPHRTQLGNQVGWLLCSAQLPEAPNDGRGVFILDY